jgi:hypothetical protein
MSHPASAGLVLPSAQDQSGSAGPDLIAAARVQPLGSPLAHKIGRSNRRWM